MHATFVIVTIIAIIANAYIAYADLTKMDFVLANSRDVGVPESSLPLLAVLKGAGAFGLLLGLFGITAIGIAAAAGLIIFYIGAMVTHIRARVFHNVAFPASFLILAIAALMLPLVKG